MPAHSAAVEFGQRRGAGARRRAGRRTARRPGGRSRAGWPGPAAPSPRCAPGRRACSSRSRRRAGGGGSPSGTRGSTGSPPGPPRSPRRPASTSGLTRWPNSPSTYQVNTRRPTPICGAASPAPPAATMVSVRSPTSWRSSVSKSTTGAAGVRSTGSPNSRMGVTLTRRSYVAAAAGPRREPEMGTGGSDEVERVQLHAHVLGDLPALRTPCTSVERVRPARRPRCAAPAPGSAPGRRPDPAGVAPGTGPRRSAPSGRRSASRNSARAPGDPDRLAIRVTGGNPSSRRSASSRSASQPGSQRTSAWTTGCPASAATTTVPAGDDGPDQRGRVQPATQGLLTRAQVGAPEERLRRWLNAAALGRPSWPGARREVTGRWRGHPVVQALVRWDPGWLASAELADRRELGFPPITRVASLSGSPGALAEFLEALRPPAGADLLGPPPEPPRAGSGRGPGAVSGPGAPQRGRCAGRRPRRGLTGHADTRERSPSTCAAGWDPLDLV